MQDLNLRPVMNEPLRQELSKQILISPSYEETRLSHKAEDQIPVWLSNAFLLLKNNETSLAKALVIKALGINSFHPEALKCLAQIEKISKNWSAVCKSYEALLKVDYCFENVVALAEAFYQINDDHKAQALYEEALTLVLEEKIELFNIYKNLGNIHVRQGDFLAAEENYNKAATIVPNSDMLFVNLGTLEIQREDYNLAADKFRRALSINAKNDKAWVGLAIVHERMGDHLLAYANIENAVEIAPDNRTAVHLMAHWFSKNNHIDVAIEVLENYLSLVQQDEEISLIFIHLLCLSNQLSKAKLEIERVLLWNPQNQEVNKLFAEIQKKENQCA